jgi:vitamin-K-epoxide reductase (warfarin-sensitive)
MTAAEAEAIESTARAQRKNVAAALSCWKRLCCFDVRETGAKKRKDGFMRFVIASLAIVGLIVSILALRVHYSNDLEPCDINAHWDCGIVNHSRYAELGHVPVAAIGIAGYLALGALALLRRRALALLFSVAGLAFALYLSSIEAYRLEVWCLYCVISQAAIALIAILSLAWILMKTPARSL